MRYCIVSKITWDGTKSSSKDIGYLTSEKDAAKFNDIHVTGKDMYYKYIQLRYSDSDESLPLITDYNNPED